MNTLAFSRIAENGGAQQRRFFCVAFCAFPFAPLLKIPGQGHLRSGHQACQVTLPKKVIAPWLIFFYESISNFLKLQLSVPSKRISRNFDLSNLKSGQFCGPTITSYVKMFKCSLFQSLIGSMLFILRPGADPGGPWGLKPPACRNGALGREGFADAEGAWKSLAVQFRGPTNHHTTPFSCNTALKMHHGALRR